MGLTPMFPPSRASGPRHAYPDGSVRYNERPWTRLGSCDAWRSNRKPRPRQHVTTEELDYAFPKLNGHGLGLFRVNLDRAHPSTREEINAIMLAFLCAQPLPMKVGNRAGVAAAQKALALHATTPASGAHPLTETSLQILALRQPPAAPAGTPQLTRPFPHTTGCCKGHAGESDVRDNKLPKTRLTTATLHHHILRPIN